AHLVEHLALEGSYDEGGQALLDDVRRAGARLNAHTSPGRTQYELDAPAAAFLPLAERLVKIVTSPAWERAPILAERGVIETEATYHGSEGLLSLVDRAVFPAPLQAGPLAGTAESRSALEIEDAARFFAARYVPSNVTFVFAGAVRMEDARGAVERTFRIPPLLPGEAAAVPQEPPSLPGQQKVTGGITATMLGYLLDPQDRAACESVAALAELRLVMQLQVEGPMLPGVSVTCPVLRGNPFIVAAAYTSTFDAGDLPAALEEALAGVGKVPPTAAERAAVDARLDRAQRRMLADPELLAERAAALVADRGDTRPLAARLARAPLPDASALRRIAGRSFGKSRRILVYVSPLQQ
ncbi:MAG TPA: insulinase family protein, partial [Anaeromyxobacter sp.]